VTPRRDDKFEPGPSFAVREHWSLTAFEHGDWAVWLINAGFMPIIIESRVGGH